MERAEVDIVIVGAGFTGVALAIQLCRRAQPGARILLAGDETSLGVAYGAAAPMHLLNVAAGRMSLDPALPGDFVAWLVANGYDEEQAEQGVPLPERYLPRVIYGRYVLDRFKEACATSPATVTRLQDTVTGLERTGERWQVHFADSPSVTAGNVALCLGNLPPRLPLPHGAVTPEALDHVIGNPWRDPRMAEIGEADRVLVLGTGLTMVDYALQWDEAGHTGATYALSRRGLLPSAHRVVAEPAVPTPTVTEARSLAEVTRLVRGAIAARADAGEDWRPIVDGLRPVTHQLWGQLTPAEQARFLRWLGSPWGVARHRMPAIAAERLAAMQAQGRLQVMAGRLLGITHKDDGLVVSVLPRGSDHPERLAVDWVVNCTGPHRDPATSDSPLLHALLAEGLARRDALQLGLDTTANDEVIGADGRPQPGLYALGAIAMGRLYEIVAVPDLRQQCAAVAVRMAGA